MTLEVPSISIQNLRKSYGDIKAVNDLSFSVEEGEVYSLLGPNGAGKTTTVEILEGLRKPDSGKIRVLGQDPWRSISNLKNRIGILPQGFQFFERVTPSEAISYYCSLFGVEDRSDELIKMVEIEEVRNVYFTNLSGGQKQKLGICLALVNDPKVIFLDEPTTGLDPRARRKIWDLIRKLKSERRTIILTTHYLEEAQILSDRVGIVDHGKMVVEGTPDEIISKMGKGRRLHVTKDPRLSQYLSDKLNLNFQSSDNELTIHIEKNEDLLQILDFMNQNSISLKNLHLKEDTLEDIFVDLVGKEED